MKRLNNKGVTLIELIVSFAIVSVAMVYFYQTLYTVRKLYVIAQTETQAFVDRDYAIRIVDKFIDEWGFDYLDGSFGSEYICNKYNLKYKGKNCKSISYDNVNKVTINWEGESPLSFYKSKIDKNVKTESGEIVEKTNDSIKDYIKKNKPILAKGSIINGSSSYFFNGNKIKKGQVESITFTSTVKKPSGYDENNKWDASFNKNNLVIAWYADNDNNGLYELIIGGEGGVFLNEESSGLFYSFSNLVSIDFNDNVYTSDVTDLYRMFYNCSALTSLDVSKFDTSKVTNMMQMFYNCSKLENLSGINKFDTHLVTNMRSMFYNCNKLNSLDVSKFDTHLVTDMAGMFYNCSALTSLDVSKFDTHLVTDMEGMFYNCSALTSLDVSKFDTSKVTNMREMFSTCSKLENLSGINKFDTHLVTNMYSMFGYCYKLKSLDLSNFNTSKVTTMKWMFYNCSSLINLDVSKFDTHLVTDMASMFYNCSSLINLDVSNFNTSKVTTMERMFYSCSKLVVLDVSKFDTYLVTNMLYMFYNCKSLGRLDISNFDMSRVKNSYKIGMTTGVPSSVIIK